MLALKGRVQSLADRSYDQSILRAKGLKATQVWVQANNRAIAYVRPTLELRAFASSSAQIYYYHVKSTYMTRYSVQSGNAFQMHW